MIVRISGEGQFELDEASIRRLDSLDTALTKAYHDGDQEQFKRCLHETVTYVQSAGKRLSDNSMVGSDVIVPPDDTSIEEAQRFMTDEGLMQPLPV